MNQPFDLFARPPAPAEEKRPLSVSELNDKAARMLEGQLGRVEVQGEISGFTAHRSGHWYFTLKDSEGQVNCCCFKGNQRYITTKPADGALIVARGRLTVYSPRGSYQFVVDHLRPAGAGELQAKLEALKAKLHAEGLFAAERKRPLPQFVRRIALVTSPDGAAVRDFLRVATERHAGVSVLVVPTVVQGPGAGAAIAEVIGMTSERAEKLGVDLLVLTRGGGSVEDLSAFNDEAVVRALASCSIPTVSAIGHEVDISLADLVADVRAPTPTAAAQMVVQDMASVHATFGQKLRELARLMRLQAADRRTRLQHGQMALRDPLRRVAKVRQRLDIASQESERALATLLETRRERMRHLLARLDRVHPERQLIADKNRLEALSQRIAVSAQKLSDRRKERFGLLAAKLDALSPLAVLKRGYAIALRDGHAVRSPADAPVGSQLQVRLSNGSLTVEVKETKDE